MNSKQPKLEQGLAHILRFLGVRPRSEFEIRTRLAKYGVSKDDTLTILKRLTDLHLLDDLAFAKYLITSRRTKGRSKRHISYELARHGFSRDQISSLLTGVTAEREAIYTLLKGKSHLPRPKLLGYLARRGFSLELVKTVLDEYNDSINRNS